MSMTKRWLDQLQEEAAKGNVAVQEQLGEAGLRQPDEETATEDYDRRWCGEFDTEDADESNEFDFDDFDDERGIDEDADAFAALDWFGDGENDFDV